MKESVESINSRVSQPASGRTLSDLMALHIPLPFPTVVDYLEQLSEAIDSAHEQGRIYRNISPSTILLTSEGRLMLTEVELASGGTEQTHKQKYVHNSRSLGNSRLMALAYMAPEQILERNVLSPGIMNLSGIAGMDRAVDGRADLYSLGVVLYQMVTGVLPFQAETPEQVALKHLRMPPPAPHQLRPDLPVAAEQAMLRALAKRPANRYIRAQDLATAFRIALMAADIQLDGQNVAQRGTLPFTQRGLFDPVWQTGIVPTVTNYHDQSEPMGVVPVADAATSPSMDDSIPPLSPARPEGGRVPAKDAPTSPLFPATAETFPAASLSPESPEGEVISPLNPLPAQVAPTGAQPPVVAPGYNSISPLPATNTTGTLPIANDELATNPSLQRQSTVSLPAGMLEGNTGTLKLTGPAKIVQVPVAGQPGMYMTGLLPVFPPASPPAGTVGQAIVTKGGRSKRTTILTLAVVVIFLVAGSGIFWLIRTHSGQAPRQVLTANMPNLNASATAKALATANANVILIDPLSQNIHNWHIATTGMMIYVFKDGAYHITDNDARQGAPAILPDELLHGSFAYTLTMEEIKGDDTSINNEFGMIIRANSQNKNGKLITTFYSFEVLNIKGGEYQFWKYDNSPGPNASPWTKLWHHPFGKEFHQGHGTGSVNTFKIFVNGKSFTLIVNGKQITTVQDSACNGCPCTCSGGVGMLVNLKGTEVAFSDLKLTYN